MAAPMGHALMLKPALWKPHVDRYLHGLKLDGTNADKRSLS
ncbi:hypothetical protein LJR016_005077 [Devosia sp. LjRoot16]